MEVALVPTARGWAINLSTPDGRDLSDLVPTIEAFDFHVVDAATTNGGDAIEQHLDVTTTQHIDEVDVARVDAALHAALTGRTAVDDLLHLVTSSTLQWREVEVLRSYRRLFELLGNGWSPSQVTRALLSNPDAASALVAVFTACLSPDADMIDQPRADHLLDTLRSGIRSLTEDRIIEDLGEAIHATVRTNAFVEDRTVITGDHAVEVLVSKFRSSQLPGVPSPTPAVEILVMSTFTDGVHLRGGPIARGGLRASDRPDDVRSEVLGLVTAQIVKNSMIVPTGAKGGFVLNDPPVDRAAHAAAVETAYRIYVNGLLAITDNVVDGEVVGPAGIRRRDGDDPYLVVAADKGTARLSDTANQLAREAGFWLDDAFASGGSAGYDHKALGITAKGAWVAIARHFRELGIDIHTDEISVVGIGDMSGDVFGNGLLTSATLRLVAAFDHRDIFIDPAPDPAATFAERRRLFEQPGSSWQDFDTDLLSEGGGVWSRQAKRIELSPQVRELLRVDDKAMAPDDLVQAILRASVDLLYAGGIGTYVAAPDEDDVDDRANAAVRVAADELRARVIGEGANLAITQPGRIAYARRGGRVDQDAIHNAAGVAISDREVNLKILMAPLVADGSLTMRQRDELLRAATDDVVDAVLADVDAQVWLLSREHARSAETIQAHRRHLDLLESRGLVDRTVDVLPDDADLQTRAEAGGGLTRPELATVVAATKRWLVDTLVVTPLVEAECAEPALHGYFPEAIRARLADQIPQHRLAPEITATQIANDLVNRLGPTTIHELAHDRDVDPGMVAASLWAAEHLLDGHQWWRRLQGLASEVPPETLDEVATTLAELQLQVGMALLDDVVHDVAGLDDVVTTLADIATELRGAATVAADSGRAAQVRVRLLDDLVPDDLAIIAATARMRAELVDVAHLTHLDDRSDDAPTTPAPARAPTVAAAIEALVVADERLRLTPLRQAVEEHLGHDDWARRHKRLLERDLVLVHRAAATALVSDATSPIARNGAALATLRADTDRALAQVRTGASEITALGVAVGRTRQFVDGLGRR